MFKMMRERVACNIFVVPRRILNELLADEHWSRRMDEAQTFQDALRVVKGFCLERGYGIHHDIVGGGRLVVCH